MNIARIEVSLIARSWIVGEFVSARSTARASRPALTALSPGRRGLDEDRHLFRTSPAKPLVSDQKWR